MARDDRTPAGHATEEALDPDATEALQRIVYEEDRVGTDLRPATLAVKVAALRPRLVETALAGETTDYRAATDGFSVVHGARAGEVLAALGHLEAAAGRPFLPAVVVAADRDVPGDWYFEMLARSDAFDERVPDDDPGRRAVWSTQVLDAWQYPWD